MLRTLCLGALLTAPCLADTLLVPGQFPTIQGAINAAATGDVVLLAPGDYNESFDFLGKAIEVAGSQGACRTTIFGDPMSIGPAVTFDSGETRNSELRDVTIAGSPFTVDLAIRIVDSSPTIRRVVFESLMPTASAPVSIAATFPVGVVEPLFLECEFRNNRAQGAFAGVLNNQGALTTMRRCWFSENEAPGLGGVAWNGGEGTLRFMDCIFEDNSAVIGGAIHNSIGSLVLRRCRFLRNTALQNKTIPGRGGALHLAPGSHVEIFGCLFDGNVSNTGGCIVQSPDSGGSLGVPDYLLIENCTFWDNQADSGPPVVGGAVLFHGTDVATDIHNSIIQGSNGDAIRGDLDELEIRESLLETVFPGSGNLVGNAGFVNATLGDFSLLAGSIARDAGSNGLVSPNEALDLRRQPRIQGVRVDMGAFETYLDPCTGLSLLIQDCNLNGEHDACEIALGTALDCNGNGIPDDGEALAELELVVILDTSGSISDNEYSAIQVGLQAALCGSGTNLPTDGRIALTVIQFGTQICADIPRTLLDSPGALSQVCAEIGMLVRATDGTVVVPALNEAYRVFSRASSECLKQVLVFTDGDFDENGSNEDLVLEACRRLYQDLGASITFGRVDPPGGDCSVQDDTLVLLTECANAPESPAFDDRYPEGSVWCLPDLTSIEAFPTGAIRFPIDSDGDGVPDDCACLGDIDGDGTVDVDDLLALNAAWGSCPTGQACPADLNSDGSVDVDDLQILLGNWGDC